MTKVNDEESTVTFKSMISVFWDNKLLILFVAVLCCSVSIIVSINLPNEYKATAILQPADSTGTGGGLGGLAAKVGGLASFAGVGLGGDGASDADIALEILNTWGFQEAFIQKYELDVMLLGVKGWDSKADTPIYDGDVFDNQKKLWLDSDILDLDQLKPKSWYLYEELKRRVQVKKDEKTGLIRISVTYYSPRIAKVWVDLLTKEINSLMKQNALDETGDKLDYLIKQANKTSLIELRTMFAGLIEEQIKKKMLAEVTDEYALKTIVESKIPEKHIFPQRALLIILGFFLGLTLGFIITLVKFLLSSQLKR